MHIHISFSTILLFPDVHSTISPKPPVFVVCWYPAGWKHCTWKHVARASGEGNAAASRWCPLESPTFGMKWGGGPDSDLSSKI